MSLTRRTFVQVSLAAATSGLMALLSTRSYAGEPPFAQLVRQGDFASAAKALQVEVDERPLDRDLRLALGKLQFGAGDFAAASQTFEIIERRGGIKDDFVIIDLGGILTAGSDELTTSSEFNDSAAWLHLAALRQEKESTLSPGAPESIRGVLLGTLSISEYVEVRKRWLTKVLDDVAARYGEAEGVAASVGVTKSRLEDSLICVANVAAAEQLMGLGNSDKARLGFTAAVNTNADRLVEFHIAKTELARLA